MSARAERVTRFDGTLFETAAAEGTRQTRSARQQLEHWARLGAALSAQVESPLNRVRQALDGTLAQRDLTLDEARQFDAAVAVRVDEAVAQADFASAPLPDFSGATPDAHQVLADLSARTGFAADARDRLRQALAQLGEALDEQRPTEGGR